MKTSGRARRRGRSLRRNPLSTKQKVLAVGGVVALGGAAAYALFRPSSASAQDSAAPPPAAPDPRAVKAQECAALQAQLAALRGQANPDRATVTQFETQVAACLAQAREMGMVVDPSVATLSAGDALYNQIEGWWAEYKATSEMDFLKRNNIRQTLLAGATALAAAYGEALTQSPNNQSTKLVAQSVLRALDAAVSRQLCYNNNERGCSTRAADEDQTDAKAAQEQTRAIAPLMAVYAQAVQKVGGPSRALALADGEQYLAITFRQCTFFKEYIDSQFAHYKATSRDDSLKRNNTRQATLAVGRDLIACLRSALASAVSFGSIRGIRAVSVLALAAINASIDRWLCFYSNGPGCETTAVNEDQPNVKAAQERDNTLVPLMALYAQIARALQARGDALAWEPLITAKLRVCAGLKAFVDAQFAHYTATRWSDALKRNNTRQAILSVGGDLASCLQDALTTAAYANSQVLPEAPALRGLGGYVTSRGGLGQALSPATTDFLLAQANRRTASALATRASDISRVMSSSRPMAVADIPRLVRPIAAATAAALDASMARKLCFLYGGTGCGTFAANEDQPNVKAEQEQERVTTPLVNVYKGTVALDSANAQSEAGLMRSLVREVTAAKEYIDAQYAHYKATEYGDWSKRDNTRKAIISAGQQLVAALRAARPATPAGRALLRPIAQAALAKSREREACFRSGAGGCDQQWGTFFEGTGGQKADQEVEHIMNPLAALVSDTSPAGLGGAEGDSGGSGYALLGALGVLGAAVYFGSQRQVTANRRTRIARRTSRR